MKKLLILGAGIYQVPLIKTAKELGVYTIVTSIPGNYPGFSVADKVYYENTVDVNAIMKIAKTEAIDGIVTTGTDVAIPTLGAICDELGLPGLSDRAALRSSDKRLMKQCYEKYNVRTARYREINLNDKNYEEKLAGLNFPLIFKSVDSSGSRGITKVNTAKDFDNAYQCVVNNTRSNYFLVEEFIEGEEFGAQAFIQNGKLEFVLPHGDYIYTGNTGVPIGHYAPYKLNADVLQDCKDTLEKAVSAMGLDNCAINADFILKDGKTYVLEIGGRSGATCLAELVSIYYGYNYYEKIIRVALGEYVSFPTNQANANASQILMASKDGIIESQQDHNILCSDGTHQNQNIIEVQFDYKPGDQVHKFSIGPHRIGHVITTGQNLEEAVNLLEDVIKQIEIKIK